MALSGDGGDELFAGYERFAAGLAARRYAALPGAAAAGAERACSACCPRGRCGGRAGSLQRFAARGRARPARRLPLVDQLRPGPRARRAARRPPRRLGARGLPRDLARAREGAHPLDRLLDLNLRTYLLDDLLVKADRMSMAHGLEVRSPFLDTELLAYTVPLARRVSRRAAHAQARAEGGGRRPAAARDHASAPKRGFGVPLDRWFREDLRATSARRSGRPTRASSSTWCRKRVDQLLAEHDARRAQPRPRALDPADARGLPAARGLVTDDGVPAVAVHLLPVARRPARPHPGRGVPRGSRRARAHDPSADVRYPDARPERRRGLAETWQRRGITWHSLRYHKRPSLPATIYDALAARRSALRIMRRHRLDAVHARNHVPAATALIVRRLTRLPN